MVGRSSSGEPCGSTDCFVLAAVRWLTFAASPMARVDIVGFAFAFSSDLCHAGAPQLQAASTPEHIYPVVS
jgi:hypothetical protein